MKKITVQNLVTGRSFGPLILSDNEAEALIAKHKGNKNTWGREERVEVMSEIPENAVSSVPLPQYMTDPNTFELVLDENGMPIEDPNNVMYSVTLPKEYDLVVEEALSALSPEQYEAELCSKKNDILTATDYTQIADCPLDTDTKRIMREYRQYLRDFTDGLTPQNVMVANLENFHEFYRRIYIEVSSQIITKTENINNKIKKILE